MRKIIRSEMSYSEPVSFDLEVYTMLKREDLDYLEKEIASLKEQLKEAEWVLVKFVPHKDTIQWDSREKLARDYFKRATQARREK